MIAVVLLAVAVVALFCMTAAILIGRPEGRHGKPGVLRNAWLRLAAAVADLFVKREPAGVLVVDDGPPTLRAHESGTWSGAELRERLGRANEAGEW